MKPSGKPSGPLCPRERKSRSKFGTVKFDPDGNLLWAQIFDTPEHNDTTKIKYCKLQYGKAVGDVWWLNAGGAICVINFKNKVEIDVLVVNILITKSPLLMPSVMFTLIFFTS